MMKQRKGSFHPSDDEDSDSSGKDKDADKPTQSDEELKSDLSSDEERVGMSEEYDLSD